MLVSCVTNGAVGEGNWREEEYDEYSVFAIDGHVGERWNRVDLLDRWYTANHEVLRNTFVPN